MIHNLRSKLKDLPQVEIRKESPPVRDFECSVFTTEYDVDKDNSLLNFINIDTKYLKTACKVLDKKDIKPDEIVFFDTETTGLSGGTGTVAFLVGVGRIEGRKFVVRQFLMNDYHQEPSVLNEFAKSLAGVKAVCTYNGKSFDAPLIKTRSIMNRVNIKLDDYIHFDLLHACRRLYKMRLERMKLTDIEEQILGITREDDIPGSEIPEIFFNYLKYGDNTMLDKVIEHNLHDIVSLAKISGILATAYSSPSDIQHAEDRYCVGRTLCTLKDYDAAQSIFSSLVGDMWQAKHELAYIKRRMGEYATAAILFDELSHLSRFEIEYDIEVAKIMEHHIKNYEQALNYSNRAKEKLINNRLLGRPLDIMDDVEKRINRIKAKMERLIQCQ